jgi:hypothetical protein
MSFNDIETRRIKNEVGEFIERRRPPPHIRPKLDLGYRISGQSVEIVEIRPVWRGPPGETRSHGVAKATYVRRHDHWKVFWLRADLKWHPYPPAPRVDKLGQFLALVDEDKHHCFFG